jgi:RNA polymerase sigma-70 factor (ECF subfamily)
MTGDDLAAFYAAAYPRLVGVVGAIAQDRDVAEEAVQDAFVRLLGQWPTVAHYDDPEAWVRKVALGFVSNRRRKVRNGLRALARLSPSLDHPGPTGAALDLRRALATLPVEQRAVVVLQDLGLSLPEVAGQLGVPVGTVKSRLSRARAALAPLLREDLDHV